MTADDIFVVADMERRLFSDPWSAVSFISALKSDNQVFLVAEEDGRIAGYCGMMCVLDEGQILNIAVDEEYRRRGFAETMMRKLIGIGMADGITLYSLEVRQSNEPAIALYRRCRFKPVGLRKEYYSNPREDAVLMELDILDTDVDE